MLATRRDVVLLALLLLTLAGVMLAWLAVDRRPPEWDHANHLERALECHRILAEPGHARFAEIVAMSSFYPPLVLCARLRRLRLALPVGLALALPSYGPRLAGLPMQILNRSYKLATEAPPTLSESGLLFYPNVRAAVRPARRAPDSVGPLGGGALPARPRPRVVGDPTARRLRAEDFTREARGVTVRAEYDADVCVGVRWRA